MITELISRKKFLIPFFKSYKNESWVWSTWDWCLLAILLTKSHSRVGEKCQIRLLWKICSKYVNFQTKWILFKEKCVRFVKGLVFRTAITLQKFDEMNRLGILSPFLSFWLTCPKEKTNPSIQKLNRKGFNCVNFLSTQLSTIIAP